MFSENEKVETKWYLMPDGIHYSGRVEYYWSIPSAPNDYHVRMITSSRFWEIDVRGCTTLIRWGTLTQSDPNTNTNSYGASEKAIRRAHQLVQKHASEGYTIES